MATATQTKPSQLTAPASKVPPADSTKGDAPPSEASPTSLLPVKKVITINKKTGEMKPAENVPTSTPTDGTSHTANEAASEKVASAVVLSLTPTQRSRFVQLRKLIRTGLKDISAKSLEVAAYLNEMKEDQLYREHYDDYPKFCAAELEIHSKSRAYELAKAGAVQLELKSAMADKSKLPANERQLRPLTKLKTPELRVQAWQRVLELAKDGRVTETFVRKAVKELEPPNSKRLFPPTPRGPVISWNAQMVERFQAMGFEAAFEQPIKWPTDAVTLFSSASNRYVKLVDTLNFNEAACVLALKEKELSCLVIVNADANAPDGLLYTAGEQPGIDKESFTQAFHVIAKQCNAVLETESKFYRAGELDESSETGWAPASYLDLELPEHTDESDDAPEPTE